MRIFSLKVLLLALPALLVGCSHGEYRERLAQLYDLQRQNVADSVMDDIERTRALVQYFDRHGISNDRMLAYYLLGRTYYDTDDMPAALEAYHAAADCADTSAIDCDYATLSRVCAQTAEIFYFQMLPTAMMKNERQAVCYALKARDTLQAAFCYSRMAEGYELQAVADSALMMLSTARDLYLRSGHPDYAASLGCSVANILIQDHDYQGAAASLSDYEQHSGLFLPDGDIEPGREIYYYIKGMLSLHTGHLDSAAHFFRRELASGGDANSQMSACKGLQHLYALRGQADSVIRYSLQGDSIAETVHRDIEMQTVLQLQAMYDYHRHQRLAQQKTIEASCAQNRFLMVLLVCVLILGIGFAGYFHYHKRLRLYTLERRLQSAPITQRLRQMAKANPPQLPSLSDWKQLRALIDREIPAFYAVLNPADRPLTDMDYDVCMLTRVYLSPTDIYKLKNCTPSYISNIRKKLLLQLFNTSGSTDQFDDYIRSIG